MSRQPKRICRTRIVLSSIETGWAGSPGPKEVNRATEGGCPGSLAFGDPGDREPQPDHSRISDVPVVSPATRLQPIFWPLPWNRGSDTTLLRSHGLRSTAPETRPSFQSSIPARQDFADTVDSFWLNECKVVGCFDPLRALGLARLLPRDRKDIESIRALLSG
jgi:hypothetical protein